MVKALSHAARHCSITARRGRYGSQRLDISLRMPPPLCESPLHLDRVQLERSGADSRPIVLPVPVSPWPCRPCLIPAPPGQASFRARIRPAARRRGSRLLFVPHKGGSLWLILVPPPFAILNNHQSPRINMSNGSTVAIDGLSSYATAPRDPRADETADASKRWIFGGLSHVGSRENWHSRCRGRGQRGSPCKEVDDARPDQLGTVQSAMALVEGP